MPQCLGYLTNTSCRTLSYPIAEGFKSVCIHGIFYNMSENIELLYNSNQTNVYCRQCVFKYVQINLSCRRGKICSITSWDIKTEGCTFRLNNVFTDLRNLILVDSIVQDHCSSICSYNEIYLQNAYISCNMFSRDKCGLYFTNTSSTKISIVNSHLYNFRLDIIVRQLLLICQKTNVTLPVINIKAKSFEYLKVPTIIEFDKVTMESFTKIMTPSKMKKKAKSYNVDYTMVLDITNPQVVIKDTCFNGTYMKIKSERQYRYFEPLFFSLVLEKCLFINSAHVGNGGGLTIISQVKNSKITILDCVFSNNSAFKGAHNDMGKGGGLYVEGNSLILIMRDCIFSDNRANDLGLALYTSQGVNNSIINCSFLYNINSRAAIQQPLVFLYGIVIKFYGMLRVSNPKPESYPGLIDIFYIAQGSDLNIDTYCPKWYNHVLDHTSVSTKKQAIMDAKYSCSPCSDNYYTLVMTNNSITYNGEENITNREKLTWNQGKDSCAPCPYGAVCTGNNVMPRPNYWGYWHKGGLVFNQCPALYCCSGTGHNSCTVYNHCSGNRTGILCGACQDGYSVSILTGACTPDSLCGESQWFWFIVILAAMAYALWYTLRGDAGQNAPPGGNSCHTTCKTPQKVVAAFVLLVLHSFPSF